MGSLTTLALTGIIVHAAVVANDLTKTPVLSFVFQPFHRADDHLGRDASRIDVSSLERAAVFVCYVVCFQLT